MLTLLFALFLIVYFKNYCFEIWIYMIAMSWVRCLHREGPLILEIATIQMIALHNGNVFPIFQPTIISASLRFRLSFPVTGFELFVFDYFQFISDFSNFGAFGKGWFSTYFPSVVELANGQWNHACFMVERVLSTTPRRTLALILCAKERWRGPLSPLPAWICRIFNYFRRCTAQQGNGKRTKEGRRKDELNSLVPALIVLNVCQGENFHWIFPFRIQYHNVLFSFSIFSFCFLIIIVIMDVM